MKQFIVKRLAQMLFVWILVSMFSFSIIYFAPGDPLYIYMTPGATGHKMTDEEMYRMRDSQVSVGRLFCPAHILLHHVSV